MSLIEATIAPRVEGKGRAFTALRLASVTADSLWEGGQTDSKFQRPVYASFVGSESELRAFAANLQLGRPALTSDGYRNKSGYEFLKSAGYKQIWQREAEGAIVTVFLPDLFLADPGMVDPKEAKFVILPPRTWATEQDVPVDKMVRHALRLPWVREMNAGNKVWKDGGYQTVPVLSADDLAALCATAHLFAYYLDRRIRAPILTDPRFYLQILLACLREKVACWSAADSYAYRDSFGQASTMGFREVGTEDAGLLPGVAFRAAHEGIEGILAAEVALYYDVTGER